MPHLVFHFHQILIILVLLPLHRSTGNSLQDSKLYNERHTYQHMGRFPERGRGISHSHQFCRFTKLFEQLQAEVRTLSSRVLEVESENLSLRKLLNENQVQDTLKPPNDALHAEILDLKNQQEEIGINRPLLNRKPRRILNHGHRWLRVRTRTPPLLLRSRKLFRPS
jgi:hypothetical protein